LSEKMAVKILLELNEKHGEGYQLRASLCDSDGTVRRSVVWDSQPFTLTAATFAAEQVLLEINRILDTRHELADVLSVTTEALEANRTRDPASEAKYRRVAG